MNRASTPELLDSDAGSAGEVDSSLADLRRINRWFGGINTTIDMIRTIATRTGEKKFSLLDVAAASGDIASIACERLRHEQIELTSTVLDRNPSHLNGSPNAVVADAMELPFRDKSFNLVACSAFVHHLGPEQIVQFVNEALRVARVAVLINDLRRSRLHLALVYAGLPLFRSRLTWHDAPASVARAYTPDELERLLRKTSATRVEISRHYLFRMGAIVWAQ
jgi:ubiquinone/menaquinone biosynthesis C-methylase UbiE